MSDLAVCGPVKSAARSVADCRIGSGVGKGLPVTPAPTPAWCQAGVPLVNWLPVPRATVKQGDTLWGIFRAVLRSPWRWPELWGMNMERCAIRHRIPGQVLARYLSGRAMLRLQARAGQAESEFSGGAGITPFAL